MSDILSASFTSFILCYKYFYWYRLPAYRALSSAHALEMEDQPQALS